MESSSGSVLEYLNGFNTYYQKNKKALIIYYNIGSAIQRILKLGSTKLESRNIVIHNAPSVRIKKEQFG